MHRHCSIALHCGCSVNQRCTTLLRLPQAQTVSLVYRHQGADYLLNLIDTPGHVDFSYEASVIDLHLCCGYLRCLLHLIDTPGHSGFQVRMGWWP